jgi:adenylate cyclase
MQMKLFNSQSSAQNVRLSRRKVETKTPHTRHQTELWNTFEDSEQQMALLFLDIRDFTPLAGLVDPSALVHLMKKLLSVFQRIVYNHHGRIVETTGDGFYAAFGFDRGLSESVNNAVCVGFAILRYLESMNTTSFEKNLKRRIEAGIGVHAGNVAQGVVRIGGEDHMIVMGQSVNIASRLQAATKELNNKFVISDRAFNMLKHSPESIEAVIKGLDDRFVVRLIGPNY